MIRPSEPAPFQVTAANPYTGPSALFLEAGAGSARVIEVGGKGKASANGITIDGPPTYKANDDYSGLALLTGHGRGYKATSVKANGLHVSFRACDGYRQDVCIQDCVIDGEFIGDAQLWVFGFMGRTAGQLIVGNSKFTRGGSRRDPVNGDGGKNQCHRIYIGTSTSLAIDGMHAYNNIAGRDVQCYGDTKDPDTGKAQRPTYWHIRNSVFEKHLLDGYTSIQTNPLITSVIENTEVHNDYRCIEAHGDVIIRGGKLTGGAGVYCMRDGIRVELDGVDVSACMLPVDKASAKNVNVVRK